MNLKCTQLCLFVIALAIFSGCAASGPSGLRPTKSEFDSQLVEVTYGGLTGERGGLPALLLSLNNKTDHTVWVNISFTLPDQSENCATAKELSPKGTATFICPQNKIVVDVPYPVSVAMFADQALTQNLETKQTKMQFTQRDVAAFMAWMTPPKLPATFADVWYRTDEAQLLLAYKENGTLTVSSDNLKFAHNKGSVEIPLSSIKKVTPQKTLFPDIANKWIVIQYRIAEKDEVIAFKSNPFVGKSSNEDIYSAISWASDKK